MRRAAVRASVVSLTTQGYSSRGSEVISDSGPKVPSWLETMIRGPRPRRWRAPRRRTRRRTKRKSLKNRRATMAFPRASGCPYIGSLCQRYCGHGPASTLVARPPRSAGAATSAPDTSDATARPAKPASVLVTRTIIAPRADARREDRGGLGEPGSGPHRDGRRCGQQQAEPCHGGVPPERVGERRAIAVRPPNRSTASSQAPNTGRRKHQERRVHPVPPRREPQRPHEEEAPGRAEREQRHRLPGRDPGSGRPTATAAAALVSTPRPSHPSTIRGKNA